MEHASELIEVVTEPLIKIERILVALLQVLFTLFAHRGGASASSITSVSSLHAHVLALSTRLLGLTPAPLALGLTLGSRDVARQLREKSASPSPCHVLPLERQASTIDSRLPGRGRVSPSLTCAATS